MCTDCLLIKNIWIADGAGSPLRRGSLLAAEGVIRDLSADVPAGLPAAATVDGGGMILAPGFLDAHGHSDLALPAAPEAFSKVSQGITSEICGNCGLSPFPLTDANREHLEELYREYGVALDWSDRSGYLAAAAGRKPCCRPVPLCGHNTLRAAVAGYDRVTLKPGELREMRQLLDAALDAGAPGLSFGLLYVPGKFASPGEIVALMETLAARGAIAAAHLRSEGGELLEAIDEMISCARAAHLAKLHFSHFKTARRENWSKLDAALERIEAARRDGLRITVDRYPYLDSMTQLSALLPSPWDDLDDSALQRRLADPEERRKLVDDLHRIRTPEFWRRLRLAATSAPHYAAFCGKMLTELGGDPAETAAELLADDANGTAVAAQGMCEENLRRILGLDFCMMGSDGYALPEGCRKGHPRSFGSAAKFMRRRLDAGSAIEAAVRRMTGLTAETFGLRDRGILAPGKMADFVIFDPDEIDSRADFTDSSRPADGILLTACGGKIVFRR